MQMNESLDRADFDIMKEIWTVSALDGIRGSFYSKELSAAEKEVRVANALIHDTESIPVGEARIRALVDGDLPMSRSEHIMAGYDRAMTMIMRDYSHLDFNEKSLLSIHRTMLSDLLVEKGRFRTGCENSMEYLFQEYDSKTTEALAYIPRILDDFSHIAPFRDGNKRMRSLLTNLLLLRNGYTAQIYVGLSDDMPLLPSLMTSYKELERRYPIVENRKVKKRDRILHIIETSSEPMKKKDICACIPDVSIRTADVVLSDLIDQNKIEKLGTFKDAKYVVV